MRPPPFMCVETGHRLILERRSSKPEARLHRMLPLLLVLPLLLLPLQVQASGIARNRRLAQQRQPAQPLAQTHHSHPDGPKLIPLSALERYPEGAELRLFCASSAGVGRLRFEWRHQELPLEPSSRLAVSMMDESASSLRIQHLQPSDAGNYTCTASNEFGTDSASTRISVNVRLKWIREPPGELQVHAGRPVQLECDATGPAGTRLAWTNLRDGRVIQGRWLRLDRAKLNDSGLYECLATSTESGEQLRKLVKIIVNGK